MLLMKHISFVYELRAYLVYVKVGESKIIYSQLSISQTKMSQSILYHRLIQSTLIISKSNGPSETLRDIRTSTYQIYRIDENTN